VNILFVSHRFPYPPTRGDKIRSFNMVRHLHAQGHKVTVASLARSGDEAQEARGIEAYCEKFICVRVRESVQKLRMVGCLAGRVPSSMGYFYAPQLKQRIEQELAQKSYDLIIVFSSSAAQYVENVRHIPKILDFCDMDSQKWLAYAKFKRFPLNLGYWLEGQKLQAEEKRLARRFDLCSCATGFEVETLENYGTGVATGVFPNGVDSTFFQPASEGFRKHHISFVGRMDYYPNEAAVIFFAREVLPQLRDRYPDVTFTIIGAEPPRAVQDLAQLPGVTVTGTVDDVRRYILESEVMVAPLAIARGTQNKILEGMALGVPVISSALAARGVDAIPGEHLLTATTAEDYVKQVSRLFDDPVARERMALAGRERVLSHHNWERAMRMFDALIDRCMTQGVKAA